MIGDTLRTRNNGLKLKCRQVNSDCTKLFFTNVLVQEWNKLPPSVVQYNRIDSFENKLDRHFLQLRKSTPDGVQCRISFQALSELRKEEAEEMREERRPDTLLLKEFKS